MANGAHKRRIRSSSSSGSEGLIQVSPLGRYDHRLGIDVIFNEARDFAAAATKDIAWRLGIFASSTDEEQYDRSRFVELSAGAYPAASPDVLRLAELWHFWLFSFDDRTDEKDGDLARDVLRHERVVSQLIAMLEVDVLGPPARDEDPHIVYLDEVLREFRRVAPARITSRFRRHVRDYLLHGSMPGAFNWMRSEIPTLEEFLPQRIQEGAVNTVLPLIELSEGIVLPDSAVMHPLVQRLEELANLIIALTNDFFSYEKEVGKNHNPNNLLSVISKQRGLGLAHSVLWALGLIDAYLDEYVRLQRLLEGQADIVRYIHGLSTWICASQNWYLASGRYSGVAPAPTPRK